MPERLVRVDGGEIQPQSIQNTPVGTAAVKDNTISNASASVSRTPIRITQVQGTPIQTSEIGGGGGGGGTGDYNDLISKPSINGVKLVGNKTSEDLYIVSEGTTAFWQSKSTYIPKKGEFVVYTDHTTKNNPDGSTTNIPAIKVGDGLAYVVDLPFTDDGLSAALDDHIEDQVRHVTLQERLFWNAKLNCEVTNEELILNRN